MPDRRGLTKPRARRQGRQGRLFSSARALSRLKAGKRVPPSTSAALVVPGRILGWGFCTARHRGWRRVMCVCSTLGMASDQRT
ncbi:uncharacterized protein K452DRAFT_116670 [Aplosporella prunicola CBS 121167]|uniref:Uncharacterized protein n=1 Tax=Aplosporella prunicola CBS 121167 TaxID=1176127 RepID=A0A6A6AZ20_9PEZI|nr:uncharacterized protein K452DRAFT_116670 [Aplosporella prunicola CBS 121167]KAF2136886.1 hypothetical protein K452DRAFT_116670 [Aplosporella prunicola CBS 121167]